MLQCPASRRQGPCGSPVAAHRKSRTLPALTRVPPCRAIWIGNPDLDIKSRVAQLDVGVSLASPVTAPKNQISSAQSYPYILRVVVVAAFSFSAAFTLFQSFLSTRDGLSASWRTRTTTLEVSFLRVDRSRPSKCRVVWQLKNIHGCQ